VLSVLCPYIKETVAALGELIAAGKIRHYGLSNETTYGVCEFVRAADELGVARWGGAA